MNTLIDLHVHLYGCLTPEDIWSLGRDIEIDSNRVDLFNHNYRKTFQRPSNYDKYWISPSGVSEIAADYLLTSRSNFQEFQAKFDLVPALFPLYPHATLVLSHVIEKHHKEGLNLVEYRCFMPPYFNDKEISDYLEALVDVAKEKEYFFNGEIKPRLVMSLPRDPSLFRHLYQMLHQWLQSHPSKQRYIVGIDLCAQESGYPPSSIEVELSRVIKNNILYPRTALAILYHVGEQYDHISLCSSLRWVYQASAAGAHRLGHAAILGVDSNLLLDSFGKEPVAERIDHIQWLLENLYWLSEYSIQLDSKRLNKELERLRQLPQESLIEFNYNQEYLEQFNMLQKALQNKLSRSNIVVESCPTSNNLLTDAPLDHRHPLVTLQRNNLKVIIGSDDPGIFNTSLSSELKIAESLSGSFESSEKYSSKSLVSKEQY